MNLRAQAMHQAARAAKEGRLSILTNDFKRDIINQSSRIPKTFTDKARIRVPPKHSTEWEGLPSPDLWDAICFAFLENVSYIVNEGDAAGGDDLAATVTDKAADLFSGV